MHLENYGDNFVIFQFCVVSIAIPIRTHAKCVYVWFIGGKKIDVINELSFQHLLHFQLWFQSFRHNAWVGFIESGYYAFLLRCVVKVAIPTRHRCPNKDNATMLVVWSATSTLSKFKSGIHAQLICKSNCNCHNRSYVRCGSHRKWSGCMDWIG